MFVAAAVCFVFKYVSGSHVANSHETVELGVSDLQSLPGLQFQTCQATLGKTVNLPKVVVSRIWSCSDFLVKMGRGYAHRGTMCAWH